MQTDLVARQHDGPIDDAAKASLAAQGIELRLVPSDDTEGFRGWIEAIARGFLDGEPTNAQVEGAFERSAQRRLVAAYDEAAPDPETPVGTFASWVAELSVPGGRGIPACAVSAVTVAPTHRRRGILRSMMEGELRRASELSVAVAVLTVSESAIYGRFGFASAAMSARARIDVPRAHWSGPRPEGRVDFISRALFRELAPGLYDRVRLSSAGELEMPEGHWDRFAGTRPDAEHPERLRAIRYTDPTGATSGLALYSVEQNHHDFPRSKARVARLIAETPDAYAALWRFLLELDLIGELEASELSVDEPVLWMIADRRAATVTVQDHQYVRLLDVPAALAARRYAAAGSAVFDVADPLGFAEGRWLLTAGDDGEATVEPWDTAAPDGVPEVRLGVTELSAAYLGSVSLTTLAAAGRVESTVPTPAPHSTDALRGASGRMGPAAAAARLLSWFEPARLSFWY